MTDASAARIGPTAHYTAYVWRRLGLPYAEHLATTKGAVLYWGFFALGEWTTRVLPGVPTMRTYLAYRHLLMDALVDELAPDVLIELGAGLTPRTVQWAIDRDIDTVDVDLPAMIDAKRDAIARLPSSLHERLTARHRLLAADVLDPGFADVLSSAIGDAERPVIVAEGLVSYFGLAERRLLFAAAARALAGRTGSFVVDLHTAAAQAEVGGATKVLRSAIRVLTRRRHALDPFVDAADYERALALAGFAGCRALDPHDWIHAKPALRGLHSPAQIVHAWVE